MKKPAVSHGRTDRSSVLHRRPSVWEKMADGLTNSFGTLGFLLSNGLFFVMWIVWNSGTVPLPEFDPYPFNLLTMVVSLEAIFLSIIVLMSQARAARLADLREEIDFHVNVKAEREITQLLFMMTRVEEKLHVPGVKDPELLSMLKVTDVDALAEKIAKEMKKYNAL